MELSDSTPYHSYERQSKIPALNEHHHNEDIINNHLSLIIRMTNLIIICPLIALFGIFTNIINMIVFYRQGFNTTTNISFFALAVSDTLCLVTALWTVFCMNPFIETADLPFIPREVVILTGGWFHVCFGRITSWITVCVTAERCLGITLPLKVKQIITLSRTTIVTCAVFVVNLCIAIPEYSTAYLDWKFVEAKNRSLYGLVFRDNREELSELIYIMNSASGIMSFVCVIFFTIFLVTSLKQKSKWRQLATGRSDNSDWKSSRNQRTIKMIIMIATVLIVCYIPGTALSLITTFVPEFNMGKALDNSFFAFWSIAVIFNVNNASVNIFLYYWMSTKYRQAFNELFSSCIKNVHA